MKNRIVLGNSAVAFALALLLMITLHEFAHGIAALAQGQRPVIYPSSEADRATAKGAIVFIALAGPVWSLVSGALVLALPQISPARVFWRLAVLWFGLLSVQEFSGYLLIGAFSTVGDVGQTYQVLDTPPWVQVGVSAVGVILTFLLGKVATRRLLELTGASADITTQLRQLGLFAWLLGAAIVAVVSIPYSASSTKIGLFELLATFTSGGFLISVRYFMKRVDVRALGPGFTWPLAGIVVLAVVALLRIVVLGPGLTL